MSNIILVQHFSGYPNDDPASVSRICLQCIPYCYSFPNWTAITPSFVQFDAMVPSSLLDCNWFYGCGICGEPCYVILCSSAAPMPAGVLEQFPEPRLIELVPPAHHPHPPPAIMAGFDFEGFELPADLASDGEGSDSDSDLSSEESDEDSALEDSPSLSDSSVSSPFLLMCATVSWMSCIVRLTQNGYILCISSCLGGSPLSKSSGVLMGAPNITS
ncbi:putative phosphatase [Frankliniella fusca]|uniref:Phosphatase n=1 Tax=Frankliniella fusca TaxID=407009 RepID=A0AAE1LG52_9NEOP|nr:putative phosphatase [Frankliniella fusca]